MTEIFSMKVLNKFFKLVWAFILEQMKIFFSSPQKIFFLGCNAEFDENSENNFVYKTIHFFGTSFKETKRISLYSHIT